MTHRQVDRTIEINIDDNPAFSAEKVYFANNSETQVFESGVSISSRNLLSVWGENKNIKSPVPIVSSKWSISKRFIDFFGALALIFLFSPLLIVLYVMVARTGDQVIFGHRRMGKNGNWFTCYKFRTMIPNAELVLADLLSSNPSMRTEWMRDEKLKNDPRITTVGKFLRKTSLDELPQLFNVLKGEMSLVGPRPITDTGVAYYGKAIKLYCAVRPGMTGLWQVSGRNEVQFRRRVAIDVYYVRTQSFLLDIKILLRTILVVFGRNGY